ncbi:MAG: hypothetical protein KDD36_06965 [Flavobacteriales bacterium]|nr:hypothetical protein [Flavobacteriales bacterium]
MSIQAEKLKLIEWLVNLKDKTTIERLKWLKEDTASAADWWDEISEAERQSIERGLKDSKEGKVIPHQEVRKKYEKWL